jgi:hypothetical protein
MPSNDNNGEQDKRHVGSTLHFWFLLEGGLSGNDHPQQEYHPQYE